MPDDEKITDPAEVARYVECARAFYACENSAVEIADPLVVVKTAGGARVMAWLPIEEEDLTA
jgi:hypothetical protein